MISLGYDYLAEHGRKRSLVSSYFSTSADPVARRLAAFLERNT